MHFAVLGSGSRGNSALVSSSDTRILIDCGFPLRETIRRLARLGVEPGQLDAVLVTHEHSDHINGANCWPGTIEYPCTSAPVPCRECASR